MLSLPTYTNASVQLSDGPRALSSVLVTADGAAAEVDVYDGKDTNGELVIKIKAADGYSKQARFTPPLLLEHGLYVAVNASTTHVTIATNPISRERPLTLPR